MTRNGSTSDIPLAKNADGQNDGLENPADTWTNTQKWLTITAAFLACYGAGLNATGILSAAEDIASEFDIDIEGFDYTVFLITAWNMAAAIMPLFALPLQEDFGVQPVLYGAYFLFIVFVVVQAVAPNFATLIVARVIAGACGGVLQDSVGGIVADLFPNDRVTRGAGLTLTIFGLLAGLTTGPAIGGGVLYSLGWRWILYIQLIVYGVFLAFAIPTLKDSRAHVRAETKGDRKGALSKALNESTVRAAKMLFTECPVGVMTLFSAFCVSTVFMMTQSIPQVYSETYNWTPWQTGVVQIAVAIGVFLGYLLCLFQDLFIYPRYSTHGDDASDYVPEPRLYSAVPVSFFGLTAGYFIYGWTADPQYHWILPTVGIFLIGFGIMVIVAATTIYISDCYVEYTASAVACIAFGENFLSALLPLATMSMYETLGFHWASSLLGFVALALSLAPIGLIIFGHRLRTYSSFIDERGSSEGSGE